ncbi:TolB family protein [Flagellimonas sp.]|uniref:TolB family protein n=1 Tax=Flagellimonas sp. TaxID=2058762 RepID=UPI003BAEB457
MKTNHLLFSTLVPVLLTISCNTKKEQPKTAEPPTKEVSYFGQTPPGITAEVFAPGIISTENFEFAITFSPKMDEMFFTRRKPEADNEIFHMKLEEGKWSDPELAFFTPEIGWDFEPHINPKGDILYFGSLRPLPDSTKSSGLNQWMSKKIPNGWGEPEPLDSPFKDRFVMYLTSSENGNLYFTSRDEGAERGDGGIYSSDNEQGQYKSVQRMGTAINFDGKWIAHPYIAPDESYIIFDGEHDSGFGESDLYISFKQNGLWTKAINMGPEVNTEKTEMCPSVSPDGKYLFFHRGVYIEGEEESGDIMWIDFGLLKEKLLSQTVVVN